jgi:hypothetical protein
MARVHLANVVAMFAGHLPRSNTSLVLACFCMALDNAHLKRGAYARHWLKAQSQPIHSNKSEGAVCLIFRKRKILQRRSTLLPGYLHALVFASHLPA